MDSAWRSASTPTSVGGIQSSSSAPSKALCKMWSKHATLGINCKSLEPLDPTTKEPMRWVACVELSSSSPANIVVKLNRHKHVMTKATFLKRGEHGRKKSIEKYLNGNK